ncbi:helicase C-terminal domain-containing protein [Desulfogranum mediterraneum]|uniref:helicase C-terminal domain-containing protein n=1 Tax=Desulfogranum mediterraneum TaxID=160661 RepID=UPI000418591E|nr:helicase C-terminal domain-containing protein [Desulfogranum mediterraneum]
MSKKRPSFKKIKKKQKYETVQDLFSNLPNRAASHGYLRVPQGDVLKDYHKISQHPDIAIELPTGTGKTTVGLLIAEWRRKVSNSRVAYLTLTNQLARQIIKEADNLGIEYANLIGNKSVRDRGEEGKYLSGDAIGISTYSNLFNVNPVIQESDVLILDDAHGGAKHVIDMWTVSIKRNKYSQIYDDVLHELRSGLTDSQYRIVCDESQINAFEMVDVHYHKEILQGVSSYLDGADTSYGDIYFPWSVIKNNLHACIFLVSCSEIVIRPIIPPTHTHEPFADTTQRIYMSATIEGVGDLERSYGVVNIKSIEAEHAEWGKRYIFIPDLYMEEDATSELIDGVWEEISDKRALLLAPSFSTADKYYQLFQDSIDDGPAKLTAKDIEESLEPFTESENTLLCLSGRYDGIDLPGEDCRLLIMAETPASVGAMELHLRSHWSLGPVLRRLERTRLIQGMGRCTRDATDFAVILMLGQSLSNSLTNQDLTSGFPMEIQKELIWGKEQGDVARGDVEDLKDMIVGLIEDPEYRKEANLSFEDIELKDTGKGRKDFEDSGKLEVKYSRSLWNGDFSDAIAKAVKLSDSIIDPAFSGYKSWWCYLESHAAKQLGNTDGEIKALVQAKGAGINAGWINNLLIKRKKTYHVKDESDAADVQAEQVWKCIVSLGWIGPKFGRHATATIDQLMNLKVPNQFHMGLENIGVFLGAEAIRSDNDGDPDVIWIFSHAKSFTFEAKTKKDSDSKIAKKHVLQAKGHVDWLHNERPTIPKEDIIPSMIAPNNLLHDGAEPHVSDLWFISSERILDFGEKVVSFVGEARTEYKGKEYGEVKDDLKKRLQLNELDVASIEKFVTLEHMKDVVC